jgi:hypothetical protein
MHKALVSLVMSSGLLAPWQGVGAAAATRAEYVIQAVAGLLGAP